MPCDEGSGARAFSLKGDNMKRVIAAILIMIFVLSFPLSVHASMAVPVPALPYVPPNTNDFMDLVFNIFGATAANITDEAEKTEAYIKLFQAVYGSAWENAYNDFLDMFENGKTSGKLTFNSNNIGIANDIISYAIEHGMQYGNSYPVSLTAAQWQERLATQYGITISSDKVNTIYSARGTGYVSNRDSFLLYAVGKKAGSEYLPTEETITFMTMATLYGNSASVRLFTNGYYYPWYSSDSAPISCNFFVYKWNPQTRVVGDYIGSASGGCAFISVTEQGTTAAYSGTVASVQAISQDIENALDNDVASVLTPQTDTLNPFISITINLPATLPTPATTVSGVEDVQDDLHIQTVPNTISSEDVADIVNQLQQSYAAQYGDIMDYSIDLTEYFPFCIPFDIGRAINFLVAEPEAPSFDWSFPVGYENGEIQYQTFTIDLSIFDPVALVLRAGLSILFCIGLGMITRSVFLRG